MGNNSKDWACPCNGCKKAQNQIIKQIIDDYKSCPNIVEYDEKLYCDTWWRHDDCERLRELLFKITNNNLYTRPDRIKEIVDIEIITEQ